MFLRSLFILCPFYFTVLRNWSSIFFVLMPLNDIILQIQMEFEKITDAVRCVGCGNFHKLLSSFQRWLKKTALETNWTQLRLRICLYFLIVKSEHTDFDTTGKIKSSDLQCSVRFSTKMTMQNRRHTLTTQ